MKNKTVYLLMILATFFWAGAFIAGKLGINALSPTLLTFFRMGLASLILFPVLIHKHPQTWKINSDQLKIVIATGLIGMIGYHMFFFSALKYTTASKAAMINASNPLITAFLASLFVSEKLTLKKIFFIFTALLSVIFILINGNIENLLTLTLNKGDLLMLCGTLSWAIYSVIVRKYIRQFGALKLSAYTFLSSTIMLAPFALITFVKTNAIAVGLNPYLAVIYMAIFPTVIGYLIQQYAIGQIGASKTALFINLVPIISTLLAVILLNETVHFYHLVSLIGIILSVIGFNRVKV
ncbi:DMT family transporter [Fusibacter ferrireducens]|uniref:DMT family transporter n=1 Tax=Fusibacter ferrireducens TaxID=2785058 RepID=A0ABR9ZTD6_9FIRM|nr:DMT family transporter [Fusibacter ferrireducens]MBF4693733.1 DMT family transporter [Fusibacter ferrireducens]